MVTLLLTQLPVDAPGWQLIRLKILALSLDLALLTPAWETQWSLLASAVPIHSIWVEKQQMGHTFFISLSLSLSFCVCVFQIIHKYQLKI